MIKISGVVVLTGLLLSGCAAKNQEKSLVTPYPAANQPIQQEAAPAAATTDSSSAFLSPSDAQPETTGTSNQLRIQQCRKELDAIKLYSKASYDKYQAEFQTISNKTNKYLQIKDSIGADVNDMVMPGYQFQIREFCFRVKNRLSQLIVRQVQ